MTGLPSGVLVIVGPTASGKSAVAEALADRINAEIVSADSMQIYRGMDIATDKPSRQRQERYRYHMIDVADAAQPFTVVQFRDMARAAIDEIAATGQLPIVVGGSGLYVRAVIDDLDFPPATRELSPEERDELQSCSTGELVHRLSRLDPAATAERIHPNNRRRLVRALEFIAETGQPFSDMQKRWSERRSIYVARILGIERRRDSLYAAINARVDAMMAAGLADEARRFLGESGAGATARQALGYKELQAYLSGTQELDQAVENLKSATRRFAKRQMTWFRTDERVEWVDAGREPAETAAAIITLLRAGGWLGQDLLRPGANL